ncbi:citrate synthase [Caballeronia choica]|jgi:citrate synthase|uniref:citrate synthase (unknown stereospecificity) n=1 Tax=Caballeronia choica TaxID=326476 RepID=A0A158K5B2_9BURK|nr:citryl-CoA lyase [Caballeronia choica]SAL76344.1 citrate synthase [Caballeronia choica]
MSEKKSEKGSSSIAKVQIDKITVRGLDLCEDVIGKTSLTEYFLLLLSGEKPSAELIKLVDASMVSIAEHGLVPSVQAARMTLASAPDALQGAVAAGLLGCGSVILGASETAGRLLVEIVAEVAGGTPLETVVRTRLTSMHQQRISLPGFGHPIHRNGDPRAASLIAYAQRLGTRGKHTEAVEELDRQVEVVYGRKLPLNVSGAIPAVLLDAGFPVDSLRGIPIMARTASLIAHLAEERVKPIGFKLAAAADRSIDFDGVEAI